jgi:hypothetical protein
MRDGWGGREKGPAKKKGGGGGKEALVSIKPEVPGFVLAGILFLVS